MRSKVLKAQFNEMCLSGIILDMESTAIYAGLKRTTAIEVTPGGINIQPGQGNPLYLATYDIRGPGYKQSMPMYDFLPTLSNFSPRKEFVIPLLDQTVDLVNVGVTYAGLAGAIL